MATAVSRNSRFRRPHFREPHNGPVRWVSSPFLSTQKGPSISNWLVNVRSHTTSKSRSALSCYFSSPFGKTCYVFLKNHLFSRDVSGTRCTRRKLGPRVSCAPIAQGSVLVRQTGEAPFLAVPQALQQTIWVPTSGASESKQRFPDKSCPPMMTDPSCQMSF